MREYNPGKYIFDTTKLIIEKPNFEVIEFQHTGKLRKRLFIFSSEDKIKCYEYFWDKLHRFFKCCACSLKRKTVIANVYQKSDGIEYVKIGQNEHVCEIREYNPEKYIFDSLKHIVKKPHFKIHNYNHHGTKKSALIIFCSTNMKLCNEYFWSNSAQTYLCAGCAKNSKTVYAKIKNNSENEEYVELSKAEHVCDLREYDPTKFKNDIFVPKSMYDIVENTVKGKRKKSLIIFTSIEKKMYYKFSYIEVDDVFRCCKCQKKKLIRAKFYKNEENGEEENLFLQDREHVCQPVQYNKEDFEDIILKKPDYQIIQRRFGGKWSQKLIVFTTKEKDYCYEYFSKKKKNLFICGSCQKLETFVHARIIKNENEKEDEECIRLSKTEHVCKPRKYLPENLDLKIVKLPGFKIEKNIFKGAETTYLYIYTTPDKKLCYKYTLQKQNQFLCYHCKKRNAAAKLCQDENGEDYIELNNVEHNCKAKEYSNSKIINLPNFKIIQNDDNKKFLFVFDQNDNSRCYTFCYQFSRESFMCKSCLNKKRKVSAKLRQYENGEEYIEIMYNNHICEPEKYEPEKYANTSKKIFEPNFKIIDGGMKLNVYDDSEDKKIVYQYNYQNKLKKFRCPKCHGLNKTVTAKIVKNEENGEKYVQLGKIDHVCRSKK
uniref:Uncharacterized protein n=1 Tax=Panagrolaimus davidi TaxID=227884 RepID=A0A914P3A2_9BILA